MLASASAALAVPLVLDESASAAGGAVIKTKKVPVGGGVVIASRGVVVTRPRKTQFRVFSASCTHQGCTVTGVADRTINCACHGSKFSIGSGGVVQGPATRSLPPVAFSIKRGKIYLD